MKPIKLRTVLTKQESRSKTKWILWVGSAEESKPQLWNVREWSKKPSFRAQQRALAELMRLAEILQQIGGD